MAVWLFSEICDLIMWSFLCCSISDNYFFYYLRIIQVTGANLLVLYILSLIVTVRGFAITLGYVCMEFQLLSELVTAPDYGSVNVYRLNSISQAILGL